MSVSVSQKLIASTAIFLLLSACSETPELLDNNDPSQYSVVRDVLLARVAFIPLILVYTDRILLERIIRNLIANVLAHTRDCDLTLHVDDEGQQLRIEVADDGPGIPLDAQELIFEEFYQIPSGDRENHGGLGLGLSIVRRLNQLLGLKMHMTSAEGDGTMFYMYVPKYPN